MSKIKELSKYNGSTWSEGVPIGADANNIDVTVSGGGTQNLQTVLGSPSNSTDLQTQISNRLVSNGGDGKSTIVGTIDNSVDESDDIGNTASAVTALSNDSQQTLWGKFNKFKRRVNNNFVKYFQTANLVTSTTGVTTSGTDSEAYTAKALNDYFANVIGYSSGSDLPSSADTVASQLSSLNNNKINKSAIANDLTTTTSGYVLDARQGKTLYDRSKTGTIGYIDEISGAVIQNGKTQTYVTSATSRGYIFINNSGTMGGIVMYSIATNGGVNIQKIGSLTNITISHSTERVKIKNESGVNIYCLWMHWGA